MRTVIVAVLCLGLAGCGGRIEKVKNLAANQLRDPASAQFRNVRQGGAFVCGEINGKNGFGGYSGFTRFIGTDNSAVIDPKGDAFFDKRWADYCS
ncbi:hypothetical protein [Caulobacter sp. RHG1]|uniref:hypothetical protein n=1 Tax=Caulobacter sp. (strain RHG1) TaxID=2545762 RepID=UPI001553C735|nr:hypothetical protein [Caulobacter sp. RHG1]NQE62960.1 hypothetical protein [Caulobacter sp. RHG1]